MKVCKKCKEEKSKKEFRVVKANKDGLDTFCGDCRHIHRKKWAENNREKINKYHRAYGRKNREKMNEIQKRWHEKHPDYWKNYKRNK